MFRALLSFVASILHSALAFFRSRENQAIVELALRQQLAVYVHRHPRPRLSPLDRAFWVTLSRFWPQWRTALVLVRPETVIRWHRKAFRGYWRWISRPGPGRPPISEETKALIARMAAENRWRARKIRAELSKLGIPLGLTTISRYLPKLGPGQDPHQRWTTFLRNHRDLIAGMDFFVVPTVRFQLLHVWYVIDHGRRRVLHFNLTSPDRRLGDSTAARRLSGPSDASVSDLRQRLDLLSRGSSLHLETRRQSQEDGDTESLAERNRRALRR
jgi:putative transposase